jgi:DNA sulfur modification protein DndC
VSVRAGLFGHVDELEAEIRELYLLDDAPWIVGYSGGKDSSVTAQMVWRAIAALPIAQRHKTVFLISTDTRVENPIISSWVERQHAAITAAAAAQAMPVVAVRLMPKIEESFWVMLIGRGYAAPRPKFRWCTERLKINPSDAFIRSISADGSGRGAILVLGTRRAESAVRAAHMDRASAAAGGSARLTAGQSIPGTRCYTPIEDLNSDEVWMTLMQRQNPWESPGHDVSNKHLLSLYRTASPDNECPVVVDTTTPSCGASRFGCWTCTMVEQDKSLLAMVENDPDHEWMAPLIAFRDRLDIENDRHLRDFRRMNGLVQLHKGRPIPGPYHESARHEWLRDLLKTEGHVRALAPEPFRTLRLISDAELEEIQRIWVTEKHELEDALPGIVQDCRGEPFSAGRLSQVPMGHLSALQSASRTPMEYALVRTVYGVRLRDLDLDKVARRFKYRSSEEAVSDLATQGDMFQRGFDPLWSRAVQAAVAAAAPSPKVPDSAAPWVLLGTLHGIMGGPEACGDPPYVEAFIAARHPRREQEAATGGP